MTNTLSVPLAVYLPSLEMLLIFVFAASLPVMFVLWIRGWLGSVKEVDPDEAIRQQEEADRAHARHGAHADAGAVAAHAHAAAMETPGTSHHGHDHGHRHHAHV
jgi:hypothetical protein